MLELEALFKLMDKDNSGSVMMEEIWHAFSEDQAVRNKMGELKMSPEDMMSFAFLMDNGDGELSLDEFVSGMSLVSAGSFTSKDLIFMQKRLEQMEAFVVCCLTELIEHGSLRPDGRAAGFATAIKAGLVQWFACFLDPEG